MRTSIVQLVCSVLLAYAGGVLAIDFTVYEKTCSELGFKKPSPAFGECVLELDRRMTTNEKANAVRLQAEEEQASRDREALEQKRREEEVAIKGDGTPAEKPAEGVMAVAGRGSELVIDRRKALNDAFLQTTGVILLCAVILFLMIRHLWAKPRRTPHQLGFWWGSWASVFMLASVASTNFHMGWAEVTYRIALTVPVTFLIAYAVGWIVRRTMHDAD